MYWSLRLESLVENRTLSSICAPVPISLKHWGLRAKERSIIGAIVGLGVQSNQRLKILCWDSSKLVDPFSESDVVLAVVV
jgi:hypothetical protein